MREARHPLRIASVRTCEIARRVGACLRDLARGAAGTHAYEQYVAHCRTHHPDRPIPSREAFFRAELTAKWNGVRRCC